MVTLTQKCQVTIPKNIRSLFGIKSGDAVDFILYKGNVILKKKKKPIPFDKWKGYLGTISTDKVMEELR
jgi:AbrB family looped-hinge helix DNA binding protein